MPPLRTLDEAALPWPPVKRQLALLAAGLVAVLVLAGQLARAARPASRVPNDSQPYWSGDTRWIAFDREAPGSGVQDVYIVAAGRGRARWLGPSTVRGWRPGGGGLLVQYNGETAIVDPGGAPTGGVARLQPTWAPIGGDCDTRSPQWGPADRLASTSDRGRVPGNATPFRYALCGERLDGPLDGARPQKLVDDARPDSPARWSPSGAQLAVAAGHECRRWGVYVVRTEGGAVHRRSNLCRFQGTAGHHLLPGTPYLDFIRGFGGDDLVVGGGRR